YSQKEVRWHMAQILPHLQLTDKESLRALNIWKKDFHTSNSSILKTFSMQAVADLSRNHLRFVAEAKQMIAEALDNGTPAMQSRAKNLQSLFVEDLQSSV